MDEEVAGQDLDETPEGGTESPSSDADAGEGEPESETREDTRYRHIRDDLYRRQSALETEFRQFAQEWRESRKPQAQDPSSDPVSARARLSQDPFGVIDEKARLAAREELKRERLETERRRAEDEAYQEFPELKDQSHPFFQRVLAEARTLQDRGNGGPDLVLYAAREVQRRHPELRDEGMTKRRQRVENGARRVTTTSKVETGVPRPKQEPESKISDREFRTARRFGFDLTKEADRKKFVAQRKYMSDYFDGNLPDSE